MGEDSIGEVQAYLDGMPLAPGIRNITLTLSEPAEPSFSVAPPFGTITVHVKVDKSFRRWFNKSSRRMSRKRFVKLLMARDIPPRIAITMADAVKNNNGRTSYRNTLWCLLSCAGVRV